MPGQQPIDRAELLLAGMPAEFRQLADWAWNRVGAETARECARLGMDAQAARETAARVAALVTKNVYSSVTWYRRSKQLGVRTISVLLLALAPAIAAAQAPSPVSTAERLGWDQVAPALADAQAYQYFLIVDGTRRTEPMLPIACSGASSPFLCSTPFPALTPGEHTIALVSAQLVQGLLVESAPSAPLRVFMVIAPAVPLNPRVLKANE